MTRGKRSIPSLGAKQRAHQPSPLVREVGSHRTRFGRPKVTYLSEERAQKVAAEYTARHPGKPPVTVYRCGTCGGFHVGNPREARS